MSAQLNRLQAFLSGAGELEVVTPAPTIRPDYFARFAKLLGATVVAAHVATAAAGPAPEPVPNAAPSVTLNTGGHDHATTHSSILTVKSIAARYLSDGRSPLKLAVKMINPEEQPEVGPMASALPDDQCVISGIRADYTKMEELAAMAGTPEQRAQVLVHESMHCRLGPALLRYVAKNPSAANFAVTFNESTADAMAILATARKDGVPAALAALEHFHHFRGMEAASPDSDGLHDSRETLNRIRDILTNSPEKVSSDGAAFALAITEGLSGATKTFTDALSSQSKDYAASPNFQANMAGFNQAVEEMAQGYLEGAYEMGVTEISLNDETASTNAQPGPGASQLQNKKMTDAPFTAAGLRQQAQEITASFTQTAGASVSKMSATIGAPAPGGRLGAAGAIGRLTTHLNSIYADPVPVAAEEISDLDSRSTAEPSRPPM